MTGKSRTFRPVALSLTVLAALLRIIPHPGNFSPVGGLALFGGARLNGAQAFLIPLLAMAVTDPILNMAAGFPAYSAMTLVIYFCFAINVLLGRLLRNTNNVAKIAGVASLGSIQFFLITNFFVWLRGVEVIYPHTLAGLNECYFAALPFFLRTVAGDLFFSVLLFAAHALLTRTIAPMERVPAAA